MPIGNEQAAIEQAMADTAANITRTAHFIGNLLAMQAPGHFIDKHGQHAVENSA